MWQPGKVADPLHTEWHFGGIKLRRWAGAMPASRQATFTPEAICVVLTRTEGRSPGQMRLSIYPRNCFGASSLPFRQESLVLEIPFQADGGRSAGPLRVATEIDMARGAGALLAHHILSLAEQIAQVPQDKLETLALATRALVTICLPSAADQSFAGSCCASSALIERARLGVRRNMASVEFGPAELARLLAMSRSKLYRLLLPEGGVAHFINRERLLQAQRELAADGTASIHAIAARVGFKDHSTFSRAFRRTFGATPTQARASGQIRLPAGAAGGLAGRHGDGWMTGSLDAGGNHAGEWDDQPKIGILG
jgi:AraC-like DNA-binding protein